MSDICKWTTMYKYRIVLQRLNQVRSDSILKKNCHSTNRLKLCSCNRLIIIVICNDYSTKSSLEVFKILSQTKNSHNLCCNCYTEMIFSNNTVKSLSKTNSYIPKSSIIHIQTSLNYNSLRIDTKFISLK